MCHANFPYLPLLNRTYAPTATTKSPNLENQTNLRAGFQMLLGMETQQETLDVHKLRPNHGSFFTRALVNMRCPNVAALVLATCSNRPVKYVGSSISRFALNEVPLQMLQFPANVPPPQ